MDYELKKCPFCGGEAKLFRAVLDNQDGMSISPICTRCRTGIFKPRFIENGEEWTAFKDETEAAEAWNRRNE